MKRARVACFVLLAATFVVHALVCWWSPVIGDDWQQELWAAHHRHHWLASFVTDNWRLGSFVDYALVRVPIVHALITPLVTIAVIVGSFAVVRQRLPRPDVWEDVLDLVILSTLMWLAQPLAGIVFFYRTTASIQLYGTALALWFLVPFVCEWKLPAWGHVLVAIAGVLVGTSNPQIALAATIACAAIVRRPAPGLIAVTAGTAFGLACAPYLDTDRVFGRSLWTNLDYLKAPMRDGGELVSLVAALVLVTLVIQKLSPARAEFEPNDDDRPELAASLRYCSIWLALCALQLFGPQFGEAMQFPAIVVLCIGALPIARVCARHGWPRTIVIALAIFTHAFMWTQALGKYHVFAGEYAERRARLEKAAPGSSVQLAPYSQVYGDSWFFGEDWAYAADREPVARAVFDVPDIDIEPPFRGLERNPGLHLVLESTLPPDKLDAPKSWPRSLKEAHRQFVELAERLEAIAPTTSVRLRVADLSFRQLAGRPLLAAWKEGEDLYAENVKHVGPDYEEHYAVPVPDELARRFTEAYVVDDDDAQSVTIVDQTVRFQPMVTGRWAIVVCDPQRCALLDVFIPTF